MKYQAKTPTVFTNMLVSKLGEISNKTVLVIRDWYTAVFLAKNNKVLFITDDPEAAEKFRLVVIRNISFGNDDDVIFINTIINKNGNIVTDNKAWLNQIKGIDMKFDVAIMNPPYDGNLHLKILEQIISVSNIVVNISPIRWLQDPLVNYKKNTDYKKFENSISKKIETIDIIPVHTATDIFNAKMPSDMGIYLCKNNIISDSYKHIVNPIVNKILKQLNCWPIFEANKKDGWRVRIPSVVNTVGGNYCRTKKNLSSIGKVLYFFNGKKDNKKWFEFFNRNQFTKTTDEITNSIKFDNEITAKNFCESYNTKLVQYYTHYVKVDVHVHPETILWVEDYSQPWTDKRFCEYFGITGYIDDNHAEPNSEWETIIKFV